MNLKIYKKNRQKEVEEFVLSMLETYGFCRNSVLDIDLLDPDKHYKKTGGVFYVLEDKGHIIGTIAIKGINSGVAELKRLYVHQDFRGKGYGKLLFQKALEYARRKKYKRVTLDTWKRFEIAQKMYEKDGFRVTKRVGEQVFMEKIL